jgi:hypothetical protein
MQAVTDEQNRRVQQALQQVRTLCTSAKAIIGELQSTSSEQRFSQGGGEEQAFALTTTVGAHVAAYCSNPEVFA